MRPSREPVNGEAHAVALSSLAVPRSTIFNLSSGNVVRISARSGVTQPFLVELRGVECHLVIIVLPAIRHEAETSEAEEHHRPR